ncbi:MAG: hypothetical protein EOP48_29895 [Sphingobacteriales bacterium]|nr:MAG: hypothetical protein EOP48_29895 [Sphingobacteriales bacterium]
MFAKRQRMIGPNASINFFLQTYYKYAKSCSSLCLIGTFTFSYHNLPESIKKVAEQYIAEVYAWLEKNFQQGRSTGEYHFAGSASAMAEIWISVLPGALQASRYLGQAFFYRTAKELKNSLLLRNGDLNHFYLKVQEQKQY